MNQEMELLWTNIWRDLNYLALVHKDDVKLVDTVDGWSPRAGSGLDPSSSFRPCSIRTSITHPTGPSPNKSTTSHISRSSCSTHTDDRSIFCPPED